MTPKCPYCSREMRPGILRTAESVGVCFEPTPGLSDTVDLAGPYIFRRDFSFRRSAASSVGLSSCAMRKTCDQQKNIRCESTGYFFHVF